MAIGLDFSKYFEWSKLLATPVYKPFKKSVCIFVAKYALLSLASILGRHLEDLRRLRSANVWSAIASKSGYIIHVKTPYSRPAALLAVNIYLLLFACG